MTGDKTSRMDVEVDMDAGEVRAVRTLRSSGNSIVVSLPPNLLQACGFAPGDDISLVADNNTGEIHLRKSTVDD